jgi:hypothetical protein
MLVISVMDSVGAEEPAAKKEVSEMLSVYAPVMIDVPVGLLPESEQTALRHLYEAGKIIDELFLVQVSPENLALRDKLMKKGDTELIRFFRINFGPWDRIEGDKPVLTDKEKPLGANFYPLDMTREEFTAWVEAHPGDKEAFESNFTVIRRDAGGGLVAVPYSTEYRERLEKAAKLLVLAADATETESLAAFLRLRAKAFLSDDYFESDMAWMDVTDNILDVTIGPYEVYEDNLFNYKAAFEAFICVRDPAESEKLEGLKSYLVKMERNLPIPDEHKNLDRGTESPISVVDIVFTAGDTKAGVQTIAFNLPNDERVREAKGSKKVMLRNMCEAKFDKILKPIAGRVLDPKQLPLVTFDAYFTHILLHEFSHGLGPGRITLADGTETTVNKMLRETYSALEECKADVVGQYNFYYLIDEGMFPRDLAHETAVTFLAGFFRSVRFGIESAHGRGNMIAFNFLKEKGAYVLDSETGRWSVDLAKAKDVIRELSNKLLMIQAAGDYEAAARMIAEYGEMGDDVKASLASLEGIPVDIEPVFALERDAPMPISAPNVKKLEPTD